MGKFTGKDENTADSDQKDVTSAIYDDYVKGKNCDTIGQERGLDSREVLAIIQTVEQTKKG
jgi:hypothetical protein